jgi:hypothetical protein
MIFRNFTRFSLLFALPISGCQKSDDLASVERAAAAKPSASTANDSPNNKSQPHVSEVSTPEKVAATIGLADGLPDLKPVLDKPFPEGATEEQLCEAINNSQEKDLWVRFGHILPMYLPSGIFILEAKSAQTEAIAKLILKNDYYADLKNCANQKTLVYSRDMPVESRDPQLKVIPHIVEQLSKHLSVKTMESFSVPGDRERLSDYCRADADLCEQLVKLDYANEGIGLCNLAILNAGSDASEDKHLKICQGLPTQMKACAHFMWEATESTAHAACKCRLRAAYQLPHDPCD